MFMARGYIATAWIIHKKAYIYIAQIEAISLALILCLSQLVAFLTF